MEFLKRIKDDLNMFGEDNATITVSRKDLETLVKAYEQLKEQSKRG